MPKPDIEIGLDPITLRGVLRIPKNPIGLVLFAHGSGSGRHSPRNTYVAEELFTAGLATLLFDLLTSDEEAIDAKSAEFRFDIPLLTERLLGATAWAQRHERLQEMTLGYFGASTGAAAALAAAARSPAIAAIVSRGGRPDLAGPSLCSVRAPTLLIVGDHDPEVLALNRAALTQLRCEARLEVVPRASHLFMEPGMLAHVASLAAAWFKRYLDQRKTVSGALQRDIWLT